MRANQLLRGVIVLLFSLTSLPLLYGQRMNAAYQAYIRKYANEAILQMKRHKIPASITIAQGLLESNAGASTLASVHNNHFGIKCHKSWQGNRAYKDDDEMGECFRSYDSPLDSYTDHSYFLQQPRYKSLFQLSLDDYQGWAKGLQRCGYATDKGYANKLIALVRTRPRGLPLVDERESIIALLHSGEEARKANDSQGPPKANPVQLLRT